jgi:hypothetical protein
MLCSFSIRAVFRLFYPDAALMAKPEALSSDIAELRQVLPKEA